MLKKILGYGVVGVLAVALVAGMVYILVRPAEVQAGQGPLGGQGQGRAAAVESGAGNRGSGAAASGGNAYGRQAGDQDCEPLGDGGQGYRGGQGSGVGGGRGSAAGVGSGGGRGQAEAAGDGVGLENPAGTWVAVTGTVVAFDDHLIVRTWERGAGLTRACGSAACAAAVSAARTRRANRKVTVTLPGGDLLIEWREKDDHVLMTGPVEYEFEGRFDPKLFAGPVA